MEAGTGGERKGTRKGKRMKGNKDERQGDPGRARYEARERGNKGRAKFDSAAICGLAQGRHGLNPWNSRRILCN